MYILTDTTCTFVFTLVTLFLSQPVTLGRVHHRHDDQKEPRPPPTKNDQSKASRLMCCHGNRVRRLLLWDDTNGGL